MQDRLLLLADAGALFEQPDDAAIDALACLVHLPPDDLSHVGRNSSWGDSFDFSTAHVCTIA